MLGAHGPDCLSCSIKIEKGSIRNMKKTQIMKVALSLALTFTLALGGVAAAYADTEIAICPETSEPDILVIAPNDSKSADTSKVTTSKTNGKSTSASKVTSSKSTKQTKKNYTSKQILNKLKKSLGDSYTSDTKETKERLKTFYGLNTKKIVSWAAETSSNTALNANCTIILKVKKGYAKTAAKKLQETYEQILDYNRWYDMDVQRALQARLYVNGNYVALIIEGKVPDSNLSAEDQAKFAKSEAKKIDKAWKKIFGSAKNKIVIPEEETRTDSDEPIVY